MERTNLPKSARVVLMVPDPDVRTAVARARWPEMVPLVDAALTHRSKVGRIPADRLVEALLVAGPRADQLLAADRRAASRQAAEAVGLAAGTDLGMSYVSGVPVRVLVDGRLTVAEAWSSLVASEPYKLPEQALALLGLALAELDAAPATPVDASVVELADALLAGATGVVHPDSNHLVDAMVRHATAGLVLADLLAPLNAAGAALFWNTVGPPDAIAALADRLRPSDEVVEAFRATVAGGSAPWPGSHLTPSGLVMLDRFAPDVAALALDLPQQSVNGLAHSRLDLVRSPELRQALARAAARGTLGRVATNEVREWYLANGADPAALATQLSSEALTSWLATATSAELVSWAASPSALSEFRMVHTTAGLQVRVAEILAEHSPGAVAMVAADNAGSCRVASDGAADTGTLVVAAVVRRCVARLGDDELAWSRLWALAPGWPATVDAALDVVDVSVS